ncbi:uncharacterized protein LOC123307708 [Coccinella septempunctata]|uniref:uncharacterized protein LOC123307708 n=1 Tax=Coccinella septempunctata TaxID=41139 RepID=UPI001D07C42E|nr:uncharacterized protein LOC123307708 [Coccinella septempunctata]
MEEFVYEDLQNLCRLCFSKTSLVSIFDHRLESTENMAEVIEVTTGVKISPTDEISHMLCNKCSHLTIQMFKFRTTSMLNDIDLREKAAIQKTVHKSMKELFQIYPNLIVPSSVIQRDVLPSVTLENNIKNYLDKSKSKLLKMKISRNVPLEPSVEDKAIEFEATESCSIEEPRSVATDIVADVNFTETLQVKENPPTSTAEKRTTNPSWETEHPHRKKSKREDTEHKNKGDSLFTVKPNYKTLHICDLCNHVLYNVRELKRHKNLHMRCSLCRTSFSSMEKTKEHQKDCSVKKIMSNMPKLEIERCDQIPELREKYPDAFRDQDVIEISEDEEEVSTNDRNPRTEPKPQNEKKYYRSLKVFVKNSTSTFTAETSVRSPCSKNANEGMKGPEGPMIQKPIFTYSKQFRKADKCENNKSCSTSGLEHDKNTKSSVLPLTLRKNDSDNSSLDKSKKIEYSIIPPATSTINYSGKQTCGGSNKPFEHVTAESGIEKENGAVNAQKKIDSEKCKEVLPDPGKLVISEPGKKEDPTKVKITSQFHVPGKLTTPKKSSNLEKSKEMPLSTNSGPNSDVGRISETLPVGGEKTSKSVSSAEIEKAKRKRKSIENSREMKKIKSAHVAQGENTTKAPSNSEPNPGKNQSQTSEKKSFRPKIIISDKDAIVVDSEEEENDCLKNLLKRLRRDENKAKKTTQTDIPCNNDIVKTKGNGFLYELKNLRNYLSFSNIPVNTTFSKVASIKYTSEVSSLMRNQMKLQNKSMNVNKKKQNTVTPMKSGSEDMQKSVVTKINAGCGNSQNTTTLKTSNESCVGSQNTTTPKTSNKSCGGSQNTTTAKTSNKSCGGSQNTTTPTKFVQGNKEKQVEQAPTNSSECSKNSKNNQTVECNMEKLNVALVNSSVGGKEKQIDMNILNPTISCSGNLITVVPSNTTLPTVHYAMSNTQLNSVNIQPSLGPYYLVSNSMTVLPANQLQSSAQMPPPTTVVNKSFPHSNYTPSTQHAVFTTGLPSIRPNVVQAQSGSSRIQLPTGASLPTTSTVPSGSRQDCSQQLPILRKIPKQTIRIVQRESVVGNNLVKIASTKDAKTCDTVRLNENNDRFSAADQQNNQTVTAAPENPKYIRVRNLAELK